MLLTSALVAACGGSSHTPAKSGGNATSASASATSGGGGVKGAYGSGSSSSGSSTSASSSSAAPAGSSGATLVSTKHNKLGMILAAGPKQLTVYLFEGDKGAVSNCTGACAAAWPPVTTTAMPSPHGQAAAADLGTITRADNTKQVTYKGHPLYYFVRDKDSGDAYGQGVKAFGAGWYVLAPSGQKIDNS